MARRRLDSLTGPGIPDGLRAGRRPSLVPVGRHRYSSGLSPFGKTSSDDGSSGEQRGVRAPEHPRGLRVMSRIPVPPNELPSALPVA